MHIKEALQLQLDVQRHLHEQLEVRYKMSTITYNLTYACPSSPSIVFVGLNRFSLINFIMSSKLHLKIRISFYKHIYVKLHQKCFKINNVYK